ncbi:MAG: hypothetical protein KatS3mg035_2175 [Bacteroidia bacterium]|nr:MAG: hypothetical protein KatS3mg035_2175 [Bacteroidia bacterium]
MVLLSFALFTVCVLDLWIDSVFRNAPWGIYKKLHSILLDTSYYDVWIIGSSRAETAFETNILSKEFKTRFFNAGIHGSKTPQTYYILKHIFRKHPLPKQVILDIDIHNLEYEDSILNIEQFAPFMNLPSIRNDFSKIDARIKFAHYFPFYEISFYGLRGLSKCYRILANNPGRYDTTFQTSGCYHSYTDYQKDHYPDTTHPFKFHPTNLMFIDSIISICQKNNVPLMCTISPIYKPDSNLKNAATYIQNYLNEKKIKCLYFHNVPDFSNNITYFSDKYHLKFNGSAIFTKIFQDSLLSIFPEFNQNRMN